MRRRQRRRWPAAAKHVRATRAQLEAGRAGGPSKPQRVPSSLDARTRIERRTADERRRERRTPRRCQRRRVSPVLGRQGERRVAYQSHKAGGRPGEDRNPTSSPQSSRRKGWEEIRLVPLPPPEGQREGSVSSPPSPPSPGRSRGSAVKPQATMRAPPRHINGRGKAEGSDGGKAGSAVRRERNEGSVARRALEGRNFRFCFLCF